MEIFEKCAELRKQKRDFVTITMTGVRGSAPQDVGAKAVVTKEGLEAGTVGGGKVEARAIEHALELLSKEIQADPELITWNLQKDIGMTCGGEATFLFEHFKSTTWSIAVFGAGHVSQELTVALSRLSCRVTCIDPRSEWVERLPSDIEAICHPEPKDLVSSLPKGTYFISITKGHAHDVPVLKEVATHFPETPYVGVIGSKIKGDRIKAELKEQGVDDKFLEKLRVPIGLPIGTNDPAEIAISICAELLGVRDQLKS